MLPADHFLAPGFLFAALRSSSFQQQLDRVAHQTDMAPYASLTDQLSISLPMPPIKEQQAIAEVLGALDDKIAANAALVRTTTDLSRALTQRSLCDADVGRLDGISTVTMGSSPVGTSYNETRDGIVMYQGTRDFGTRYPTPRVFTTSPVRLAHANDVLISVRAPVGALNMAAEDTCIGRGLAAATSPWPNALYFLLEVQSDLFAPFNTDGTIFGSINKDQLNQLPLKLPTDGVAALQAEIEPLEAVVRNALCESETLAELRDTLLPALMDGTIRVKDAVTAAEEVL